MENLDQQLLVEPKVDEKLLAEGVARSICYRFVMESPSNYVVAGRSYNIEDSSVAICANGQKFRFCAEGILNGLRSK